MQDIHSGQLKLLNTIGQMVKAIDDEVDWFIASFAEKDIERRKLAREIFYKKVEVRQQLAKEANERPS